MEKIKQEKKPRFIDLFSQELENKLKTEGKIYRRKKEPIQGARQVTEATVVETRLPDGTIESTRDAKPGDWVITGSKGERFVLTDKKFHSLYESDDNGAWIPREWRIIAIPNPFGESVRISAPWGTPEKPAYQDGSEKAMFVAKLSSDGTMTENRYIIGDYEMLLNNYDSAENNVGLDVRKKY